MTYSDYPLRFASFTGPHSCHFVTFCHFRVTICVILRWPETRLSPIWERASWTILQGFLTVVRRALELLELDKPQKCHRWNNNSCNKFYYSRAAPFLNTTAEFFDPNAMQLQTACSIFFFLPGSGT